MATDAKLAALATGQKLARFRRELPLALCSRPRDECGLCLLKQGLKDQDHLFYKMAWGIGTILERIASAYSLQSNADADPNSKFSITRQKAGKLGPGVEIGGLSLVGRPAEPRAQIVCSLSSFFVFGHTCDDGASKNGSARVTKYNVVVGDGGAIFALKRLITWRHQRSERASMQCTFGLWDHGSCEMANCGAIRSLLTFHF